MTASISTRAGLDHHTPDSDPTAAWSPVPQAYSELAPADDDPIPSPLAAAPRYYGNGPVIAALLGAGLACAALGLVIVDNIDPSPPRTVAVAPGAATGPANASAPGIGADFVAPAGEPTQPAPAAAPLPGPVPVVASGLPAAGLDSPPPSPPPPAPADGPAPADPAAADPGSPPPPAGPVVVVNVPVLPVPPPVHFLPPPPPPVVKLPPPPVIPLPIVKLPPPAPGPTVCLPPHHLVAGHCQ
jgi:hypothetical protein